MKYKVGDKVRVRSDLEHYQHYGTQQFMPSMDKHKGSIVTIRTVFTKSNDYIIEEDEDDNFWFWTDEMFEEKVESKFGGRRMTNLEYLKSLPDITFEHYLKDIAEECFNHDGRYGILCTGFCGECFKKWLLDKKES